MSPEALRRRMAHGNIYQVEKVDAAMASYFRPGNLGALRELALLWLADRVDETVERYRRDSGIHTSWPTRERVVVALTGGPEGQTILRRGARMASRGAGGELIAVWVSSSDGLADTNTAAINAQRVLTEELGGVFHHITGDDIGEAILAFGRRVNASQIVLGASSRRRWAALWSRGVSETVVAGSGDIDVHLVTHARATSPPPIRSSVALGPHRRIGGWIVSLAGPALLTAVLLATRDAHDIPLDVMLFLACSVGVALLGGIGPALLSAVLGSLLLNWFFVPPLQTFTISESQNVLTLVVYLAVAAAVAAAVHLSARSSSAARVAQHEAATLTQITHAMLSSTEPLPLLLSECLGMFGMRGAGIVQRPIGGPARLLAAAGEFTLADVENASVQERVDEGTTLILTGPALHSGDQGLVTAYAANAAAVLNRQRLRTEAAAAKGLAQDNRAQHALLSAVSHDLRTPLAAVKAAVSSLRSTEVQWSPEDEAELLEAIEESSDRLEVLVGNLLDLSRLETGALTPRCILLDARAAASTTMAAASASKRLHLWADGACPAYVDPGLLDRVLANLVENALKYSPPGRDVTVNVACVGERTQIRVIDQGSGVPRQEQERIFEPFQRRGDVPDGDGVGLGLAVARGLAESMGATVTADDTPGGGLTMTIEMPAGPPTTPEVAWGESP